ncbi:MAG: hypothetical protein K2X87_08225 [Gemmataceae bacterium]|nr:hypothetical protein [Gemmataceae bacterium]
MQDKPADMYQQIAHYITINDISTLAGPVPKIDFKTIDFPSDKLSIKDLRRAFPKLGYDLWLEDRFDYRFKTGEIRRPMSLDDTIHALLDFERDFAEQAFLQALGVPLRDGGGYLHEEAVETLRSDYIKLGLAAGDHQVAELVRNVERQAVAQANQHRGRRP